LIQRVTSLLGEQGQRLKDEAKNRADAVYNYITPLAFWDLGEVKVDNERLVPGAKGDYESRLYKRVAKKKIVGQISMLVTLQVLPFTATGTITILIPVLFLRLG
jgi:hypothetical protein